MTYQLGFIIEQTLGHITHCQNLQSNLVNLAEIETHWGLPAWEVGDGAKHLPLYRSNWTLRAGWRGRQALKSMRRKAKLDALFIHTQVPAVLMQDWMVKIPTVVSLDATPRQYDQLGLSYNHQTGPVWAEQVKWQLNRDCYRRSKRLVTWSEWAKQGLIEEYEVREDKVVVIPPGVNTARWAAPERNPDGAGPVRILFVGGNLKRKGGDLLLEAFRRLRTMTAEPKSGPDLELHLVTRDPVEAQPGVFVYRDFQPNDADLIRLYHDSDIFCLPTEGDCLPMVLSEAAAAGLPIVSTRVAAIPEIVLEGDTGFLIQVGDLEGLVTALSSLIHSPELRHRQGAAGIRHVRQGFDAAANARRLVELMIEMVDEAGKVRAAA